MAISLSTQFFSSLLLLSTLSISFWIRTAQATNPCWFPNGKVASDFVPCSPNGDGGCCASGDFCTGLGYCISNSKGYHYRGACTDSTWFNPSCPDYCLADTNSGNSTFVNVIACNAATTARTWCCAYNNTNCCSEGATYKASFGTIFAEPGSSTSSAAGTTFPTPASTTPTASTTPSSTTSSSITSNQTSSPAIATPAAKSSNEGAIVGCAIGIPLGLALIGSLYLLVRERSKAKRMMNVVPQMGEYDVQKASYLDSTSSEAPPPPPRKTYELSSHRTVELPTQNARGGY